MPRSCPCHSGKAYKDCCKPFHNGAIPPDALTLMRSRYSAYASQMVDYILKTTHPSHPNFQNLDLWKNEISLFCQSTQFNGLEILEFIDGDLEAYVTFRAVLSQNGTDTSFTEKSLFEKLNDRWLYVSGIFL